MGFVLVVSILKLKGMNYLIILLLLPESWLHHHHHQEQEEQGHQPQQEDSVNPESRAPVLFSVRFPEKVSRCYAGNVHTGSQCCPGVQQQNPSMLDPVHCLQHWMDVKQNKGLFKYTKHWWLIWIISINAYIMSDQFRLQSIFGTTGLVY